MTFYCVPCRMQVEDMAWHRGEYHYDEDHQSAEVMLDGCCDLDDLIVEQMGDDAFRLAYERTFAANWYVRD